MENSGCNIITPTLPNKGTRVRPDRRRTVRVIDFGISNTDEFINSQIWKRNWNISDHIPIELKINMKHDTRADIKRIIFDRDLLTNKRVIRAITRNLPDFNVEDKVEDLLNKFNIEMQNKLKELKVIREEKIMDKKFILSKIIKKKIKKKNAIEKLVRSNKLSLINYTRAKKDLNKHIKRFRRQRYINYIKRGMKVLKENDYRNSWKWLKNQAGLNKKSKLNNCDLIDRSTGLVISDNEMKKNIWSKHFSKLSKKSDKTYDENEIYLVNENIENIMDGEITWNEMEIELKATRNGKAASEDRIPRELYKVVLEDNTSNFSKFLLMMLNRIFIEGCCPKAWEVGIVVPIYKKGNVNNTDNYRGITIINTMQKLLTKILAKRLQNICDEFNLLKNEQAGFVKGGECMAQVVALLECCQRRKIRNKNTILCFLDLKKAYDLVSHKLLIKKLKRKSLGNKFISYIEKMYQNTKMKVKIDDELSDEFKYERGVRQGCPTSPLLFNIFIDDLLDNIEPIDVEGLENGFRGLMFADDTVIAADNFNDLKNKLDIINNWMNNNEMEINPSKCGIMIINKENEILELEEIKYNNEIIPIINEYVYLGVEFNDKLDLKKCAEYKRNKGLQINRLLGPTLNNTLVPIE